MQPGVYDFIHRSVGKVGAKLCLIEFVILPEETLRPAQERRSMSTGGAMNNPVFVFELAATSLMTAMA